MSNIWDKYKSTVRTHISVPEGRTLITENQWKAKHFIKVDEQSGKYLWVNANCPFKKLYLWDEEVRPMTEQELAKYRAGEKTRRITKVHLVTIMQTAVMLLRTAINKECDINCRQESIYQNLQD